MNRQEGMRARAEVEGPVIGAWGVHSQKQEDTKNTSTDAGRRGNVAVGVWNCQLTVRMKKVSGKEKP